MDLERLAERLAGHLASRPVRTEEPQDVAPAAVLVPLFPDPPRGLCTLLTARTRRVRDHKGQISFPGGVREECDGDLLATALRETAEEIALSPSRVRVLGRLDDTVTLTGYLIRPYVGLLPGRPEVKPNPVEIAEVLWVPLARLRAPGAYAVRRIETDGWNVESPAYDFEGHIVWGATARILTDLLGRIGGLIDELADSSRRT